jgi:hypothetical protein
MSESNKDRKVWGWIYIYKESQAIGALGDAINFLDATTSMHVRCGQNYII